VKALYIIDPGPDGSLGDVSWIIAARQNGTLPLMIVQAVLLTPLAEAADFVLPGAAYVEKDAIYTNETGHVQASSSASAPPGDALEDWQILVNVGRAPRPYAAVRQFGRRRPRDRRPPAREHPTRMPTSWFSTGRSGAQLAAGLEPVRALEVGFHVSRPAARQRTQRADGGTAAAAAFIP
jgi:anaerobic selenocysteine-containing dehydrogenase